MQDETWGRGLWQGLSDGSGCARPGPSFPSTSFLGRTRLCWACQLTALYAWAPGLPAVGSLAPGSNLALTFLSTGEESEPALPSLYLVVPKASFWKGQWPHQEPAFCLVSALSSQSHPPQSQDCLQVALPNTFRMARGTMSSLARPGHAMRCPWTKGEVSPA